MTKVLVTDRTTGAVLGHLVEPDVGEPFGTTDLLDQMFTGDRTAQYREYAAGWSNGYVETKSVTR